MNEGNIGDTTSNIRQFTSEISIPIENTRMTQEIRFLKRQNHSKYFLFNINILINTLLRTVFFALFVFFSNSNFLNS